MLTNFNTNKNPATNQDEEDEEEVEEEEEDELEEVKQASRPPSKGIKPVEVIGPR